jgi:hypothetical protein
MGVYDKAFSWWYDKAEAKCWKDPIWAEIQLRRDDGNGNFLTLFSEEDDLGPDEWATQDKIFERINPRPLWLRFLKLAETLYRLPHSTRYKIRYAKQRIKRGYSDQDLWSFDSYLAGIIAGGCEDLARISHGVPGNLTEGEWESVLKTIAVGFRDYAKDKFSESDGVPLSDEESTYNKGFDEFRKNFGALWD